MSKEYKSVPAEFLTFLKDAPVGSGICMCGDNMADHSPHGDHAAVEMWDHTLASWLDDIRALNAAGTLESQALSTALQHKGRYAEMLNDIITASGVAKPTDVSDNLQGPDLIAVAISAMWLIQNQRETLDQARQVIEMFMPNVASCFGIDVGALNRTMMNIAMVQRGEAPDDEVTLRTIARRILAKLDHPTNAVTSMDTDLLRKALGGN